ncbi:hypothetical protein M9H77_05568 [Catharanthus roseus]|uniref:Uncharacterized protein n=1 Tax=Catharanthus roseus TaxID=4058 RepID=A0ACC0CHE8_CATRO|nr:hypothetical protein M9H77_05568 [Catharanthus roseus]
MIANSSVNRMDTDVGSLRRNPVECKICHDEDEDSNMEIPCSCSGSLKYAHRKCVQRWCNVKGDTICEICRQHFKPGYSAPSSLSRYGSIAINLRGGWEITRDLPNIEFIGMVSTDNYLSNPVFDDYSEHGTRRLICCRIVAIIFTVLLVLRHTLPIIISCEGEYSAEVLMLLTLKIIGILLPIYLIVKAFTAIKSRRRHHHQDFWNSHGSMSDEETELPLQQPPRPMLIHGR